MMDTKAVLESVGLELSMLANGGAVIVDTERHESLIVPKRRLEKVINHVIKTGRLPNHIVDPTQS